MATALSSISPPAVATHSTLSPSKVCKISQAQWAPKTFIWPHFHSVQTKSPFSARAAATVEDGRQSGDVSMSIDVLKRFIDLNAGNWTGSFHQFDCNGDLLHKINTKLAASSYGEDELMSLIQSLYIKQPPLSTSDPEEWFEYKIKETNMFTVDKYQQIGFFPKEKAFALRYQTAGMLETVIRQGVLGEDDTGEEFPRNLKLPSRRPAIVCENCLYSLERDTRIRAFHIMDPQGILQMLLVFLEERGRSKEIAHPSFDDSKDSDRLTPHLGTWKGQSITKRSGVYGATIAEADTIATLEMNGDGQLVQEIKSTSGGGDVTTSVNWTGSISNNTVSFNGGFQLTLLAWGHLHGMSFRYREERPRIEVVSFGGSVGPSRRPRDRDWSGHSMSRA
ncbi:hypothetical protein PHJA_002958200 [Phtheirospermum japonicum]|uniref:DUF3598 domain-containing protein n=1 Tax=Phtheirospermum japonicum TaxID=374723 RepID=A0A830DR10_9LAMI|nr:hypothetical protein PHJA_002958200 [Phtheirospermum japonicum]